MVGRSVISRSKSSDAVLHIGTVTSGAAGVGAAVTALPGGERVDIMRNHTATHMMNLALREIVGEHIEQKGSLVDAEKLRFDFSHDKPLTPAEIAEIEAMVNRDIREDLPVSATVVPLAEAKKLPGVRAVFGEKYPDPVRVVAIGAADLAHVDDGMSIEFCGGTHLGRTSQASAWPVVNDRSEQSPGGIRNLCSPLTASTPEGFNASCLHTEIIQAQPPPPGLTSQVEPHRPEKGSRRRAPTTGRKARGGGGVMPRKRQTHFHTRNLAPSAESVQFAKLPGQTGFPLGPMHSKPCASHDRADFPSRID